MLNLCVYDDDDDGGIFRFRSLYLFISVILYLLPILLCMSGCEKLSVIHQVQVRVLACQPFQTNKSSPV